MKKTIRLTRQQQKLVESHLHIVYWTIRENIHANENICGLGYEDLYQEGCILLCHAAASYDAARAQFPTYAKKVVRNGLLSYCRQVCSRQQRFCPLEPSGQGDLAVDGSPPEPSCDFGMQSSTFETMDLLESSKKDYQGIARLGIEALGMKIQGMGITEIARHYGVPASHVGAWISRSARKLRNDPGFMSGIY